MQTFSSMQRSIINYQYITPIFLFIGLIAYETLANLNLYFTPLAGLIFLYIVQNFSDEEKKANIIVLFIYLIYFEIDRSFFVFSSIIVFLVFYNFFYHNLVATIACKHCLKVSIIAIYYIGFYITNLILDLMFNLELPKLDITYIIYFITDSILVML